MEVLLVMDETLDLIQKYANERHMLYRLAGKQYLTGEQRSRLEELNNKLPVLWDSYRREYASGWQRGGKVKTGTSERQAA
jgi:hypothetical protein